MVKSAAAASEETKRRPGVAQQRQSILDAAIDLMSARGTRAVSVSEICRQAGVSRDTYYRCFADKAALVDALYQSSVNAHIETVMAAWDMDYRDKAWLHRVSEQTIDAILEQHRVARFLFRESADPDSPAYQVIHGAYERAAQRMQRWCLETQGTRPSREYLVALLVAIQWLVQDAIQSGMEPAAITRAKSAAEELLFAAFAGYGRPATGTIGDS